MDDDIDCNRVILALYEFLDDELTSEGRRHVESHLHGCPHCYSAFDFEAELRLVVRTRLRVDAPETLRVRIVAALEREGLPPRQRRPPPVTGFVLPAVPDPPAPPDPVDHPWAAPRSGARHHWVRRRAATPGGSTDVLRSVTVAGIERLKRSVT